MNISIESRKLSIIEHLAEVEDEAVIQQIENLLKPRTDFWDELNDREKALIKQGLSDLEQGKRIDFQEFIKNREIATKSSTSLPIPRTSSVSNS